MSFTIPRRGCHGGGGIHVNIPANWLALCMAGTAVPGCTYTGGAYTISVSFVGDSQTVGTGSGTGVDGFRPGTNTNLVARAFTNISWDYKGPTDYTSQGAAAPTQHCGAVGGTTSAYWLNRITTVNEWGVGQIRTNVWRVMLGANDLFQGLQSSYGSNMTALFAAMWAAEPDSVISVGRLVYPGGDPTSVAAMNTTLASIVSTLQASGKPIVLEADAGIVAPTDIYQADGLNVHFVDSGNTKMVTVASDGIVAALQRGGYLP